MSVPAWVEKFTYNATGPEQRWINLGAEPSSMVIGWITAETDAESVVYYGTKAGGPYSLSATGSSDSYTYGQYTSGLIHHVTLTGLKLNTPYYYVVGATGAQSDEAAFNSSRGVGAVYPYTLAAIGDLGESAQATTTVQQLVDGLDHVDAIQFNGDISCKSNTAHPRPKNPPQRHNTLNLTPTPRKTRADVSPRAARRGTPSSA